MADWDTIVIGAGAAGLVAAERSAALGRRTLLIEKANKAGVKILMSGGTRCNVTHATDCRGIVAAFGNNGRFLHSALSYLGPSDIVELFLDAGVPTKVEETGKVFPISDRAIDVRDGLLKRLNASGATLQLGTAVETIDQAEDRFIVSSASQKWECENLILTVGGQSYPGCGTTGDGYPWVKAWGHSIVPPVPSLAPLSSPAQWLTELSGVTFEHVQFSLWDTPYDSATRPKRPLEVSTGGLLITHRGLSGPAAMNVSRGYSRATSGKPLLATCDWFPSENHEALSQRFRKELADEPKRELVTVLSRWVFRRFAEALIAHLKLDPFRRAGEVSQTMVRQIVTALKELPIPISGTLGFAKAEVTAGGVSLKEVDSRTMASRLVPRLFLAGEILDLDGPIGGFNFTSAFATGWLAGYQGAEPQAWPEVRASRRA